MVFLYVLRVLYVLVGVKRNNLFWQIVEARKKLENGTRSLVLASQVYRRPEGLANDIIHGTVWCRRTRMSVMPLR